MQKRIAKALEKLYYPYFVPIHVLYIILYLLLVKNILGSEQASHVGPAWYAQSLEDRLAQELPFCKEMSPLA